MKICAISSANSELGDDVKDTGDSWDTLVFGVEPMTWTSFRKLIEGFWPKVVTHLREFKDVEIAEPSQEAWFHLRRTMPRTDIVEVLRLRRAAVSVEHAEIVRRLGEKEVGVHWVGWCPETFEAHHDKAFLSFLQKLSVLRTVGRTSWPEYLAQISDPDYSKCQHCQKAYKLMTTPGGEWYVELSPWFDYMESTQMNNRNRHEYAHWFGHIISGWPNAS